MRIARPVSTITLGVGLVVWSRRLAEARSEPARLSTWVGDFRRLVPAPSAAQPTATTGGAAFDRKLRDDPVGVAPASSLSGSRQSRQWPANRGATRERAR